MFKEVERELSFGSWIAQLILAWCAPLLVFGLLAPFGALLAVRDEVLSQILGYVIVAAAAVFLALLLSTLAKESSPREGALVWILPVGFEILGFVLEVVGFGIVSAFHDLFFTSVPAHGEEGLAILLLTLPTWSCCWYSATMWFQIRRRRQNRETSSHPL